MTEIGIHPEIAKEIASFSACCHVIDILIQAKKGIIDTVTAENMLKQSVPEWIRAHEEAYGHLGMKPKGHWMMDVADQIGSCEVVLDLFIIERLRSN